MTYRVERAEGATWMDAPGSTDLTALSERPAQSADWRWARVAMLIGAAVLALLGPSAGDQWPPRPWFIPIHDSVVATLGLTTAVLLLSEFLVTLDGTLLILVAAYGYASVMPVLHLLTFPGLFSPAGLLGAGPQTTAWLYFGWHAGVAVAIAVHALVRRWRPAGHPVRSVPWALAATAAGALVPAASALLLTTRGHAWLPMLMDGDADQPGKRIVAVTVLAMMAATLPLLLWRRRASVLEVWLCIASWTWVCEIALEAVLNRGRYSEGWYMGRAFGIAASGLLLAGLLVQAGRAQFRFIAAHRRELHQRQRLQETRSELARSERLSAEAVRSAQTARLAERDLRELAAARLESREAERRRLARDLHDEFGQLLTAIRLELDAIGAPGDRPADDLAAALTRIRSVLDLAHESLRRVVADLRPPMLDDLGLVAAIRSMATRFTEGHGIACDLRISPWAASLPEPISTAAFRIVQECLTNVLRHSGATRVTIEVAAAPGTGTLLIRVQDDGRGFAAQGSTHTGGLAGIRERVLALGGRMVVDGPVNQGTTVTATIPVPSSKAT